MDEEHNPVPGDPGAVRVSGELTTIREDMLAAPAETRQDFEKGMSLAPWLTLVMIAANIVVFGITLANGALQSEEAIIGAGALVRTRVLEGEVWRLVSAMFLHADFGHVFGNCLALYVLGVAGEHAYGHARLGFLYLTAGVGGALASTALTMGPSVGASGAIFGLMGVMVAFFRRHGKHFILRDNRVGVVILVWALYSIVTAFAVPYIDNSAHIGGLLTGFAVGYALRPEILERSGPA